MRVMKLGDGEVIKGGGTSFPVTDAFDGASSFDDVGRKKGKWKGFAHFFRSSDTTATSRVMITTIRMT